MKKVGCSGLYRKQLQKEQNGAKRKRPKGATFLAFHFSNQQHFPGSSEKEIEFLQSVCTSISILRNVLLNLDNSVRLSSSRFMIEFEIKQALFFLWKLNLGAWLF